MSMKFLTIPIGALCLALFPLSYDGYALVRWVVFVFAALAFYRLYKSATRDVRWYGFIAVVVVYNPFAPFHLSRGLWVVLDILSIGFLAFVAMSTRSSEGLDDATSHAVHRNFDSNRETSEALNSIEKAGDKVAQTMVMSGILTLVLLLLITFAVRK